MISKIKKLNNFLNRYELLLILLLIALALRIPSLFEPFWYGDENIYLAIGQGIRKGLILYKDIVDFPNKPPMIYLFAALVQGVYGFRLLLLFWNLLNVALFHTLASRFSQNKIISTAASLLFIFLTATPMIEGNVANAENFFILPTTIALLFLTTKPRSKSLKTTRPLFHFLAGLALGFGFLFKIHVALDIAAIGLYFYIFEKKLDLQLPFKIIKDKLVWLFAIGLALPITFTLIIWGSYGVSPLDLFLNASGSTGYVGIWGSDQILLQTLGFGDLRARAILLIILTVLLYIYKKKLKPAVTLTSLWLLFTLFAALLSARPYPHYLLQPALPAILALTLIFTLKSIKQKAVIAFFILLIAAAIFRFGFGRYQVITYYKNFFAYATSQIDRNEYYRRFDSRMPRNYRLAKAITRLTSPEDKIYIWGTEPGIYTMADRLPVEKLVTSFHVADLNYYDQTLTALEANPPRVIVFMQSESRPFPGLSSFLATKYALIEKIGDPDKSHSQNQGKFALIYRRL